MQIILPEKTSKWLLISLAQTEHGKQVPSGKKNSKEDSRKVLATHIPREGLKDEIEWIHLKAGDYTTIKSGYWFLNHKTEGLEENAKF